MNKRRVVITGLGAVTPLGLDVESSWAAVLNGESGVRTIDRFDVSGFSTTIAAFVQHFNPDLAMSPKEQRKVDLFVQYAAEAARQAMEDARLEVTDVLAPRCGTAFGAGIGGLAWIEQNHDALVQKGPRRVSPFFIPGSIINMAPGVISIQHRLKGPIISVVTACATGLHNIGLAARMIACGDADVMLAGGVEATNSPLTLAGFSQARALSTRNDDPTRASRPWDKHRDGFVVGEGAGAVVLESYEFARARGAQIYAELTGFGMSSDASHMTLPDQEANGAVACMRNALLDAGIDHSELSYINAHGTSTQANDRGETLAIKRLFGEAAYRIPVSSTKSMTGHLLGAAGAVETIFSVLAIRDQLIPPTINCDEPDEDCDLDYVPHQKRAIPVHHVLCNSFGFGGANAALLVSRCKDAS